MIYIYFYPTTLVHSYSYLVGWTIWGSLVISSLYAYWVVLYIAALSYLHTHHNCFKSVIFFSHMCYYCTHFTQVEHSRDVHGSLDRDKVCVFSINKRCEKIVLDNLVPPVRLVKKIWMVVI